MAPFPFAGDMLRKVVETGNLYGHRGAFYLWNSPATPGHKFTADRTGSGYPEARPCSAAEPEQADHPNLPEHL